MITLGQLLQSQKPGINQNPYGYKIVDILSLFELSNKTNDDKLIKEARDYTSIYQTPESIPEELLYRYIHHIEPTINDTGRLFLRIVLI